MDQISADCHLDYYPAAHTEGTRDPSVIKWVVLHDEEASTARSAAMYFQSSASRGSAHLCVDDSICYRCLKNEDIPWGASSAFGANTHGFHIEQAGFARWSAVVWRSHLATLKRAAYKTAFHCHKFNIPPIWVNAAELPLKGGVTTHVEVSKASKRLDPEHAWRYTHTDPGVFWPRRLFMRYVDGYFKQLA